MGLTINALPHTVVLSDKLLVRSLPRMLGYRIDGTEEDLRALTRLGIVVAFEPIPSMQSGKE